jgi:hypothetical protein
VFVDSLKISAADEKQFSNTSFSDISQLIYRVYGGSQIRKHRLVAEAKYISILLLEILGSMTMVDIEKNSIVRTVVSLIWFFMDVQLFVDQIIGCDLNMIKNVIKFSSDKNVIDCAKGILTICSRNNSENFDEHKQIS